MTFSHREPGRLTVPALHTPPHYLDVPPARRRAIEALAEHLVSGQTVALSTHMNADGDGCGSETALARLLAQRGIAARLVNPTPWPPLFEFLLGTDVVNATARGAAALKGIDALVVLDISDVKRLGVLADTVRALTVPKLVIDHHIASDDPAGSVVVTDTVACATAELVYDVASVLDLTITPPIARSLYTGILTDTGGFRFSNTSPRCHAIAADLLHAGVDPEDMYVRVYASSPVGRLRLLAEVLATLEVDAAAGLSWLSMNASAMKRFDVRQEDLDGIVEHARSIAGTRMAVFFRDLGHGKVKISFRSTGDVDVNAFARRFDGGGHAKASGAVVAGSLDEVRDRVITAAREFLDG
ncbi:MAG TPA: bifunctional oligoribonuclease/PAP phosphatase NrnA [Gemmatimonadaceae bacterium]|nr:bifunctional oligoribonuclease/PAP phosphatase NrnA [Gemmatimonadaceae bacterium]